MTLCRSHCIKFYVNFLPRIDKFTNSFQYTIIHRKKKHKKQKTNNNILAFIQHLRNQISLLLICIYLRRNPFLEPLQNCMSRITIQKNLVSQPLYRSFSTLCFFHQTENVSHSSLTPWSPHFNCKGSIKIYAASCNLTLAQT